MAIDPRLATFTSQPPPPPPPPPPDPAEASTVQIDGGTDNFSSASASSKAKSPSPAPVANAESKNIPYKLKYCTVCASNNNRSMEAHSRLSLSANPVISFGTGSLVRLPGPSISQPQVYPFNTTSYATMYDELMAKDAKLYRYNGCLNMLERNKNLKWGPERFQDWVVGAPRTTQGERGDKGASGVEGGVVDVIITCEERCWDAVVDNLLDRGAPLNRPVHVFNIDIRDNHEEALVGGTAIQELADALNKAAAEERDKVAADAWDKGSQNIRREFDEQVPDILAEWQEKWPNLPALWTLSWF